jgi:fluoride exporter
MTMAPVLSGCGTDAAVLSPFRNKNAKDLPMHTLASYMIVFVGAGIGGALRHGVNVAFRALDSEFPYGTLLINVVGALVMGLLAGLFAVKFDLGQSWRLFLTTWILGGFTTFSTFSLEAAVLYERGEFGTMAVYVIASVIFSIGGLFAGLFIVRQFG